jgi:hypothetical protein
VNAVALQCYMGTLCCIVSYFGPSTGFELGNLVLSLASASKAFRTIMPFQVVDHIHGEFQGDM